MDDLECERLLQNLYASFSIEIGACWSNEAMSLLTQTKFLKKKKGKKKHFTLKQTTSVKH